MIHPLRYNGHLHDQMVLLNKRILYSPSFRGKRRHITTSNFGSCLSSSVRKENKTSKPPMSSEVRSGEMAQETVSPCLFCKWGGGEIKSLAHLPKQPAPVSVTSMGLQHPTLQPLTPEVGLETIVSKMPAAWVGGVHTRDSFLVREYVKHAKGLRFLGDHSATAKLLSAETRRLFTGHPQSSRRRNRARSFPSRSAL